MRYLKEFSMMLAAFPLLEALRAKTRSTRMFLGDVAADFAFDTASKNAEVLSVPIA